MAKPAGKRASKPPSKPPPPPPSSPPPYPFTTPSPPLASYLSTLNQSHIYIIHTDPYPIPHKRGIFCVPLILNILLTLLLLWRVQAAIPAYFAILSALLGLDSTAHIDVSDASWTALADVGVRRTVMFFVDFALARFVLGWPWDFFYWGDPPGPARWRWEMGFQEREVVVRRSRRWGEEVVGRDEEVMGVGKIGGVVYRERVLPAVEKRWVEGRTGYAMMDKNWDLYFKGMMDAQKFVAKGKATLEDFERKVAVCTEEKGWMVWEIGRLEEGGLENEGRKKIESVKNGLTALGKENLFFRWIELVQFETAGQGRLTAERREDIMRKGKELFQAQEVDFDEFWDGVGGLKGMPGMEMAEGAVS